MTNAVPGFELTADWLESLSGDLGSLTQNLGSLLELQNLLVDLENLDLSLLLGRIQRFLSDNQPDQIFQE